MPDRTALVRARHGSLSPLRLAIAAAKADAGAEMGQIAGRKLRREFEALPEAARMLSADVTNVLRAGYTRRQRMAMQNQRLAPGEIGASETSAILPPSSLLPPLF